MLQENYTVIVPILFAIIAVLIKLLSRREGDKSPKRNDTCIGQSLIVGALSASLAFAVNAQKVVEDLNENTVKKALLVSQAKERIKVETPPDINDLALTQQFEREIIQTSTQVFQKTKVVRLCLVLIAVCFILVLLFAIVDKYQAFKEIRSPSLFGVADLKDLNNLAVKLRNTDEALSQYLLGKLSPKMRQRLQEYNSHSSSPVSESLKRDLVNELNQLLEVPDLFLEQRLAQATLTEETRKLFKSKSRIVIRLNRLLLEEAYPHEIVKSQVEEGSDCKSFQRQWFWWAVVNLVGLVGFVFVLLLTKPGK